MQNLQLTRLVFFARLTVLAALAAWMIPSQGLWPSLTIDGATPIADCGKCEKDDKKDDEEVLLT